MHDLTWAPHSCSAETRELEQFIVGHEGEQAPVFAGPHAFATDEFVDHIMHAPASVVVEQQDEVGHGAQQRYAQQVVDGVGHAEVEAVLLGFNSKFLGAKIAAEEVFDGE